MEISGRDVPGVTISQDRGYRIRQNANSRYSAVISAVAAGSY